MNHLDVFRDKTVAQALVKKIHREALSELVFMEVCGGHTMAIHKYGIPSLLPENIKLISGPGCPVCVTGIEFIDQLIAFSDDSNNIIASYGDLIRVPGTDSTLEKQRASGADVRIITSPLDATNLAELNTDRNIIFPGIGFETTAPSSAACILEAEKKDLKNFFIHSAHKVMPPALDALAGGDCIFDGLIAPGHVSAITGSGIYEPLVRDYSLGCVISGFEPVDLLQTILMLVRQKENSTPLLEIQYSRVVKKEGNIKARKVMNKVFEPDNHVWRGMGVIENSGLKLRKEYHRFDALSNIKIREYNSKEPLACRCGEVMKGLINPSDCSLFAKTCLPEYPVGACMVSNEGACNAWYRYRSYE